MNTISFFLFTLSMAAIAASAAPAQQTSAGTRPRNIDMKHITLDLQFDIKKKQAFGTAALTFSPLYNTGKITLDAGMLKINSIRLEDGTPLLFNYDGGDKNDGLEIILNRNYLANEDITVIIDYSTTRINNTDPNNLGGSNGKGIRYFEPITAEPKKRKQMWSMGEPESNRYWFPGYDSPDDLRTTEFKATVDKDITFISNGILLETKDNNDGTHTFHYKTNTPHANHLTSFAAGEYVNVKQNYKDIPLNNFCYPDEAEATAASVERLPDMMKFYTEFTGAEFPYKVYSQIFVQDLPWGMAGITASTQTENMVDDFGTHADFFYLWDGLEGESLAQQWFGNHITCSDWNHVWLTKAFSRYLSGMYDEYKNGREEFLLYQHGFDISTYLSDYGSGIRQPVVNKNKENTFDFVNGNYPYFHGASVLHMLRKELGDDKWREAVRLYVKTNAGKTVTTNDLQKAVETASGKSMQWFFDQWVYGTGHPVFNISKKYDDEKKILTVYAKQVQTADSSDNNGKVKYFRGTVEIEIDNSIEKVRIEPKAENKFRFKVTHQPKLVNFDYESTWIKEITFEKTQDELLYQLINDKDITGKQWAMNELVALAKDEKTSLEDKEKIYAGMRGLILSESYWRIRFNALGQLQSLTAPVTETKPVALDKATTEMLLKVIKDDSSWVRANAIRFLGMTRDAKYAGIYIKAFTDPSDRVINTAAIALGKSKSPEAFAELVKLKDKPSWKNQSLISTLYGLKELGDPRGYDIAYNALSDLSLARWTLAVPFWDFRIIAAQTIASLGRSSEAYPMISERFKSSMNDNDLNVIFNNVLLITALADPRGQEAFDMLRMRFSDDANTMTAVEQYESMFKEAI